MASNLLLLRRTATKNVFIDISNLIKSKVNRFKISRSRTLFMNKSKSTAYSVGLSTLFGLYIYNNQSHCAANEDDASAKKSNDKEDEITQLIKKASPLATKLGFGGIMGFFAGAAVKRFGEEVAVYIGIAFLGLQTLQYFGYINIGNNYYKLSKDLEKKLDVTGDGKLDQDDVIVVWKEVKKALTYHLPSASGFSLGLLLGVYYY